jgi:hypothetical protein
MTKHSNTLNMIPSLTTIQNKFIIYIRTLQYWHHIKEDANPTDFVSISFKNITQKHNLKANDLKLLIDKRYIEQKEQISNKGIKYFQYRTILKGPISIDLISPDSSNQSNLHCIMKNYLKEVSMPENYTCTKYFDLFLRYKNKHIDLFFNVDYFGKRVHTPVTILDLKYRDQILLKGEKTASIDIATMQPLLLAEILKKNIGPNQFTDIVYNDDIYIYLQNKANLETRASAKKFFYKIAFGKPNNKLNQYFGDENWINWINELKSKPLDINPKKDKVHNNLAFLLQSKEVEVMSQIWQKLANNGIYFLSIHDEVLIRESDIVKAKEIVDRILQKHFSIYKLNINHTANKAIISEPLLEDEVSIPKKEIVDLRTDSVQLNSIQYKWLNDLIELIEYFERITPPLTPMKINDYTIITDLAKFINSHIHTAWSYDGNTITLNCLKRLNDVKSYIENNH